jgi:uncharacterized membrane protein YkoI
MCTLLLAVGSAPVALAKDGNSGSGGGGNSGSGGGGHGGDDNDDDNDRDDDDRDDDDKEDDDKLEKDISTKVKKGDIEPLAKVLKAALDHTPGKILDVKLRRRMLSYAYRIKILDTTGRKRELLIDAKTLKVIKVS